MSDTEEEVYSVMFSSLRHPARRKILRMLSEKTMTFSQMLEELAIPSSHLTYHLENLGELIAKDKAGKYGLSSFGKASVCMMKSAEEVPTGNSKKFSALPLRWKSFIAIFAIAIILVGSFSFVQYSAIGQLSSNYSDLKAKLENAQSLNDRLLHWSPSGELASIIINDVIQIDVSKYETKIVSSTAEVREDLGGVIQEDFSYTLTNAQSKFELTLVFRDNHFEQFVLRQLEGAPNFPPIYTQPQPIDPLQATKALIQRYKSVMNDTYIEEANRLLASASNTGSEQTLGNTKLTLTAYGSIATARLMYTENGTDFADKCMYISFENRIISTFRDDWFLYKIGHAQVNVSRDQAILAVKEAARSFSWNINGTRVSGFQILDSPVSAELVSYTKGTDSLTLYPYWIINLHLDKIYPGGVSIITAGVWADSGQVENMQALAST